MRPPQIPFPTLLQDFFLQRLVAERGASPRTIASYRDAFELLLRFTEKQTGKAASALTLPDLDAPLVLRFLDHLETERHNSPRSRNTRLAAIRSFMRYASLRDPASLPIAQRVLAISSKRFDRAVPEFLTREEVVAVLDTPDRTTWSGRRDTVLLATLYNTGARVSEMTALRVADVLADRGFAVRLRGKGRKQRVIPLWKSTAALMRDWLRRAAQDPQAPVFPNRSGHPLSRSGVEQRLRLAVARAAQCCPTLAGRSVSPHMLRHSVAMHMLQSGARMSFISLWLGHEDIATTRIYAEADLAMKEAALARLPDPAPRRGRFRATDRLLGFLEGL